MKSRWILNIIMLAIVAGLVAFLYLRPDQTVSNKTMYAVSDLKLGAVTQLKVEFPAKAPVIFNKVNGYWQMEKPYHNRADQLSVQRILSVIAAESEVQFPATNLAKFGLDNPQLKVIMTIDGGTEMFTYGSYNSVTEQQYVAYHNHVYLLDGRYSEDTKTQPIEMVDKNLLAPSESKLVTGLDLAHLEQWEASQLNINIDNGQWKTNIDNAKPTQNDMNEWFEFSWMQNPAKSVEVYTPNRQKTYPSLELKLSNGQRIHLDKMMESPELLLARPDEGLIYHFASDVGFTMLNPPINMQEEKMQEDKQP